jgi:UDP-N-acetylglucosamine diphosphorylase / glucose-1-phosphate thymidylyltransferase / UDP-N-acetylgalactosamine diphosphorylase / glucosamine-1-phosphate N-acetyltransferase / galactosamine-1-phosphate N-acetyltransferase
MRMILVDRPTEKRRNFYPLALSRPIWELRCGMTTLGQKLVDRLRPAEVACFVPPYLADVYRTETSWPVNDPASLAGDDLLVVDTRIKADGLADFLSSQAAGSGVKPGGAAAPQVALDADGEVLAAHIRRGDLAKLRTDSIEALLRSAKEAFLAGGQKSANVPTWDYTWELVLDNARQLAQDFTAAGRNGIEGTIEQPGAIRGDPRSIFIAPGAVVHPMVVLDAAAGPIYIDEGAEIHPFTRIEGPCYIGKQTILLGAKCREGNSIGPMCRIGGEIEESIVQGFSNKYHDGFLGHAYIGEWVNLGALTTNSDLKNDYSNVAITLDGHRQLDTGSKKVGALIGDHAKTSIGTLLNTGTYVGAMTLLVANGGLLPKFIPSFAWYLDGVLGTGFGKARLYSGAKVALARRQRQWTEADEALWDEIFRLTAPERDAAIERSQRQAGRRTHG